MKFGYSPIGYFEVQPETDFERDFLLANFQRNDILSVNSDGRDSEGRVRVVLNHERGYCVAPRRKEQSA